MKYVICIQHNEHYNVFNVKLIITLIKNIIIVPQLMNALLINITIMVQNIEEILRPAHVDINSIIYIIKNILLYNYNNI